MTGRSLNTNVAAQTIATRFTFAAFRSRSSRWTNVSARTRRARDVISTTAGSV